MAYPYLSDFLNHILETKWNIPIPVFGSFLALAIIVSIFVAKKEVIRFENLGLLPKANVTSKGFIPTHQMILSLITVTVPFGMLGARLFHILEYPSEFFDNPMGMIFSRSGFSIYGGLIFGSIAGIIFLRKHSIPIILMLDALAPSMILGYGIGRIGCQVSGDGDWGIAANMALKPNWISDWLWAQTYENNFVGEVIQSPGVYPTPLYESLTAFCIFFFLWSIRKTEYSKGYIFSVYLLLSGFGRLLIEKIRINSEYDFLGWSFTQAEFISTIIILTGLLGILKTTRSKFIPKIAFSLIILGALSACTRI